MACGPQWEVDDGVASAFTRTLFDQVKRGRPTAEAYRVALQDVGTRWPALRDLTLLVHHERVLA
jgi:hypothetical protein